MSDDEPGVLWYQAARENPGNDEGRRRRYLELMRAHGHIVDREPGDTSPLFACGYDPRRSCPECGYQNVSTICTHCGAPITPIRSSGES